MFTDPVFDWSSEAPMLIPSPVWLRFFSLLLEKHVFALWHHEHTQNYSHAITLMHYLPGPAARTRFDDFKVKTAHIHSQSNYITSHPVKTWIYVFVFKPMVQTSVTKNTTAMLIFSTAVNGTWQEYTRLEQFVPSSSNLSFHSIPLVWVQYVDSTSVLKFS